MMNSISKKGTVLVVASSIDSFELKDGKPVKTGYFLNELTVPVQAVLAAGYDILLATPKGNQPSVDEHSLDISHFHNDQTAFEHAVDFVNLHPAMQNPVTLRAAIENGLDHFAAVFLPGGHAPMADLMQDTDLGEILRYFHTHAKPTALLCHGPVAITAAITHAVDYRKSLVSGDVDTAKKLAEDWIYKGYRMTVISNDEEHYAEKHLLGDRKVPYYVADALSIAGGVMEYAATGIFTPHVVQDRELITGQNPSSDQELARLLVDALENDRQQAV